MTKETPSVGSRCAKAKKWFGKLVVRKRFEVLSTWKIWIMDDIYATCVHVSSRDSDTDEFKKFSLK